LKGVRNVKVVLLAGGLGTRISEESHFIPKPMIEIGGKRIFWHIMKIYSSYGFTEFIICCGYKQYVIKAFFADYFLHMSDVTFDFSCNNKVTVHNNSAEPWKVTVIDTGLHTMTGGRIKRVEDYVGNQTFMMTYGDGVSDVNIAKLLEFHEMNGKIATLTAVQPAGRFGSLEIDDSATVTSFKEKSQDEGGWINGGFMVLNPKIFDYINGDQSVFEKETLEVISKKRELTAFKHTGFWQCMDTLRDKELLENLWNSQDAPWKVW